MDFLHRRLLVLPQRTAFAWGYVEDIARGHILALEKGRPGETYILAGPVHTMEQAVTELVRLTGLPTRALRPGPRTVRALAAAMDLVGKVAPLPSLYAGETLRSIAGTSFTATSAKAARELGFTARGLAAGFRDTLLHELPLLGRKDLVARVAAVPAAEVSA
jgi:nucleoside-diphosphate-sugar epimerase